MTDEQLADLIDQCAAISLIGSDGIKGYLPVGSPKIISAALRAATRPAPTEALRYSCNTNTLNEVRDFLQDIIGGAAITENSIEHAKQFIFELDELIPPSALPVGEAGSAASRDEIAIHFLACDASSDIDWARPRFHEWKNQAHFGDCTKAPITCSRCLTEDAYKRADVLVAALPSEAIGRELPQDLPADVIAAVVGGGITSDQVTKVWGLIRAALQLRDMTGSAVSRPQRGTV